MIFSDLYYSANIVRVIKPRIDGWSVQRVWGRGVFRVLVGNLRERDHFEDPGVDGRIILRWIFRKWDRAGSGQRQVAGTCECDNEPSGCIKCGEFLD
jgi:hypothetical protein